MEVIIILKFINLLRKNNIKISNAELLDLYNTLGFVDCDKQILKTSLQTCLIKQKEDIPTFNDLFEGYFYINKEQSDYNQQFDNLLYMFTDNNKINFNTDDIASNIKYSNNLDVDIKNYLQQNNQSFDNDIVNQIKYKIINQNLDAINNISTNIEDIPFKDYKDLNDADIKQALKKLSDRLLKTYIRKQRYTRMGQINIKKTITQVLNPKIIYNKKKQEKHNLIIVADISGSMTDYIYYILQVLVNIINVFNDVKIYVFMEKVKELKNFDTIQEDILYLYNKSKLGYGTDYNNTLYMLDNKNIYNKQTYMLIIGDGISKKNGIQYLQSINKKVKKIYWLNPTTMDEWDSNVLSYSLYSKMIECKNLNQLITIINEVILNV